VAESNDPPLPFDFTEVLVSHGLKPTRALIMTPAQEMVFGRERVSRAARAPSLSAVERRMLARIEARSAETSLLILDASPGGDNRWRFDSSFTTDELEDVGVAFLSALLPFYRRVAAAGIVLFAHVGWSPTDLIPVRTGLVRLLEDARIRSQDPALVALDQWIAKNLVFYSSLTLDHFTKTLLPKHIPLLAGRQARVRELVGRVCPAELS